MDNPVDEQEISDLYRLDVTTRAHTRSRGRAPLAALHLPRRIHAGGGPGSGPYSRLVLVDTASGGPEDAVLPRGGNVYTPAFSPDGKRLAFTFNLRGFQDVYVADYQALLQDPWICRTTGLPLKMST